MGGERDTAAPFLAVLDGRRYPRLSALLFSSDMEYEGFFFRSSCDRQRAAQLERLEGICWLIRPADESQD